MEAIVNMDFKEMLNGLFKLTFITEDELENLYKAGELYGQGKSIQFGRWLNQEGWTEYDEADRWICKDGYNSRNVLTTKQLYEKFEKSLNA